MKVTINLYKATVVLVVLLSFTALNSQESDRVSLSNGDIGKLEKADKTFQEATLLLQEAESLMSESAQFTEEKEINKKQKQALSKQSDAAEAFKKANEIKYEIYTQKISDFSFYYKGSPEEIGYAKILETQSKSDYSSAQGQRAEAESEGDFIIKYAKVSSVIQTENNSIENLKKSFELYSMIPYNGSASPTTQTASASSDNLADLTSLSTLDTTSTSSSYSSTPTTESTVSTSTDTSFSSLSSYTPVSENTTIAQTTEPVSSPTSVDPAISTTYTSTPETTSSSQPTGDATNIYQAIQVNEKMIDQFNKFLSETYPNDYEKYVIDYSSLDYSNIESIKKQWYSYQYGPEIAQTMVDPAYLPQNQQTAAIDSSSKPVQPENIAQLTSSEPVAVAQSKTLPTDAEINKGQVDAPEPAKQPDSSPSYAASSEPSGNIETTEPKTTRTREKHSFANQNVAVPGFTFQVQIVACRVPLTMEALQKIYQGSEQPVETLDYNWYQYTIGTYDTYAAAREMRDQTNVAGAFVVAFINGKRINVSKALVNPETYDVVPAAISSNISQELEFRLQVIACRSQLSENELSKINSSNEKIEMIEEDGWFKYSYNFGSDYENAKKTLNEKSIPGSFVVAYYEGKKISIKEALHIKKK